MIRVRFSSMGRRQARSLKEPVASRARPDYGELAVRQNAEFWDSLGGTADFTFSTVVKRPASMLKVLV